MPSHVSPTKGELHEKRVLRDTTEWYDRLEKLAEIRQQAASAIPHANSDHEKQDKK
jgi:hypothetical protein